MIAASNDLRTLNAFTVDVEDYYHVSAFEQRVSRSQWNQHESRVVNSTQRILDLLAQQQVHGTFYVLGWVADKFPQLVQQIHAAGHEIGSHSYWHRLVYQLTPAEFREDLRRSLDALQQITGEQVRLYRAPSFSITKDSLWALEILAEEGITCDSSIFPVHHDRYGIPNARPDIHSISAGNHEICEFPPSISRLGGMNVPCSGGGYFRLYPWFVSRALLARINAKSSRPFMFYVHPWEVDHRQPRIRAGSFVANCRHYVNLHSTYRKLEYLLQHFRFGRVSDVLQAALQPTALQPSEVPQVSA
ncbi:MAG: DUF3473 domain-containing protein [Planctomycetota bacterium]|nr:DUF3473 domain-containing protein [Planctomycetota bacterium]